MRVDSANTTKKESFNSNHSNLPLLHKRRYTNAKVSPALDKLNSDSFFWKSGHAPTNEMSHIEVINNRTYLNGPGPGKYGRATSIGHLNHDLTLKMGPAYTISKAERFADRNDYSREFGSSSSFWFRPATGESNISRCTSAYSGPGPAKYGRASSIGHLNTDLTLTKPPAYSIGKAERIIDFNSNPHLGRPKTPRAAVTPGPLDYSYEKHNNPYKTSVPAYSIGKAQRFPTIIV